MCTRVQVPAAFHGRIIVLTNVVRSRVCGLDRFHFKTRWETGSSRLSIPEVVRIREESVLDNAAPHAGLEERTTNGTSQTGASETAMPAVEPREIDYDPAPVKKARRSTSHLKAVPETLAQRDAIKAAADRFMQDVDRSHAFTRDDLEKFGRSFLDQEGLPEKFLGFVMVMLGNSFWKRQFLAVPFERRMLLLPHCLKHAEGCPAEYDEFGPTVVHRKSA